MIAVPDALISFHVALASRFKMFCFSMCVGQLDFVVCAVIVPIGFSGGLYYALDNLHAEFF